MYPKIKKAWLIKSREELKRKLLKPEEKIFGQQKKLYMPSMKVIDYINYSGVTTNKEANLMAYTKQQSKEVTDLLKQGLKKCTCCSKVKLLKHFPRSSRNKSGYYCKCKECRSCATLEDKTRLDYRKGLYKKGLQKCVCCGKIKTLDYFYKSIHNMFKVHLKCKQDCKVFHFKTTSIDPDSVIYIEKSAKQKARACQTNHLKQLQLDEFGHNYCEKCGTKGDIELHHTLEVAKFGLEAINSAGHLLLCKTCHKEFTKMCRN